MKKYLLAIAFVISAMTGFAQDALTIENLALTPGETGNLNVILINQELNYRACQFDFTLPTGVDVQRTSSGKISEKKSLALTPRSLNEDDEWEFIPGLAEPSDRLFRVTMYNKDNNSFMGESGGAILTIAVTAAADFVSGEGKVSAIVLTSADGKQTIKPADATFVVGDLTGISSVKAAAQQGEVFDLQGRRIVAPQKGVYIQNGKKIVVK